MIKEIIETARELKEKESITNMRTLASKTYKSCKSQGFDSLDYWFVLGLLKSEFTPAVHPVIPVSGGSQEQSTHRTIFS